MRRVMSLVVLAATMMSAAPASAGSAHETCAPLATVPFQEPTGLVLSGGGAADIIVAASTTSDITRRMESVSNIGHSHHDAAASCSRHHAEHPEGTR